MPTENITKFSQAVAASPELQAQVQAIHAAAARDTAEKIAALSAESGAPVTAEEFLASAHSAQGELSDEQLEAVAGGSWWVVGPNNIMMSAIYGIIGCGIMAATSVKLRDDARACSLSGDGDGVG